MKVLVVGQGGREHALLWKIKKSKRVKELYAAPGNGGTEKISKNIPIQTDDINGLCEFAKDRKIDLTVVGPEAPLAAGIVDIFKENRLRVFGPVKKGARLETSKIFTKELCRENNIPTAWFEIFTDFKKAKNFISSKGAPIVVKADGLAQGKGVIVAREEKEAESAAYDILVKKIFGSSGDRVIVEECLEGEEASIIVISDGDNIVALPSSQDHKRVFDGDSGPNTGGMGAYSPAAIVTDDIFNATISRIVKPAISGLKEKGISFKGVLYAGIMITKDGPKLLEFNVRFGDPETQAILPRLESDIVELMENAISGSLKGYKLKLSRKSSLCVVIASGGYPDKYEKRKVVSGIEDASQVEGAIVFHAGTKMEKGKLLTNGGRVLNVVGLGNDIREAKNKAYKACEMIRFEGMHYRKDIGYRAIGKYK